jgi:hypothetical protein
LAKDKEYDFGFTFANEDELVTDTSREKLIQLRDMIMPLLNNLKKNPDKEMIKWPNRITSIDAMIAKINTLVE